MVGWEEDRDIGRVGRGGSGGRGSGSRREETDAWACFLCVRRRYVSLAILSTRTEMIEVMSSVYGSEMRHWYGKVVGAWQ